MSEAAWPHSCPARSSQRTRPLPVRFDFPAFFAEARRVLRPDGTLAIWGACSGGQRDLRCQPSCSRLCELRRRLHSASPPIRPARRLRHAVFHQPTGAHARPGSPGRAAAGAAGAAHLSAGRALGPPTLAGGQQASARPACCWTGAAAAAMCVHPTRPHPLHPPHPASSFSYRGLEPTAADFGVVQRLEGLSMHKDVNLAGVVRWQGGRQ